LELHDVEMPEPGPGDVLVRVRAAGICHSDAHYRAGVSPMGKLPITLGHEISGMVERVGSDVRSHRPGDRVGLHYLVTCGTCGAWRGGLECRGESGAIPGPHVEGGCERGAMLGPHVDGGFAEAIVVPARNAVRLPANIPFDHGAIMMCSSA